MLNLLCYHEFCTASFQNVSKSHQFKSSVLISEEELEAERTWPEGTSNHMGLRSRISALSFKQLSFNDMVFEQLF